MTNSEHIQTVAEMNAEFQSQAEQLKRRYGIAPFKDLLAVIRTIADNFGFENPDLEYVYQRKEDPESGVKLTIEFWPHKNESYPFNILNKNDATVLRIDFERMGVNLGRNKVHIWWGLPPEDLIEEPPFFAYWMNSNGRLYHLGETERDALYTLIDIAPTMGGEEWEKWGEIARLSIALHGGEVVE